MIVNCFNCNKELKINPSRLKNKTHHCSKQCSGITSSKRQSEKIKTNCVVCNKELFYKQSHFKQIAQPACSRKCSAKVTSVRNKGEKNPKALKLTEFERYFHSRIKNLKLRAEAKKLDFNLTREDLIFQYKLQKGICYYSGIKLDFSKGPIKYNTLSVDRVDSSKGYTKDNIVLCLNSINMFKSNHNIKEIKNVFKGIYMKEKNNIKVSFKKLYDNSLIPKQSDPLAAGYDLFVNKIEENETSVTIYTGIAIQPELGFYFMLVPRSSTHKKGLILYNNLGIIDVNYSGEIMAKFYKTKDYKSNSINIGDRLVQLIPQEQIWIDFVEKENLETTDRNNLGFGSSGR